MIETLSKQFAITGAVDVVEGEGGLPCIWMKHQGASAQVFLHGAHVTHYQPAGQAPVLWMSELARFDPPGAIRGGVPVCWPWFGSPDTHKGLPAHGFARNQTWRLIRSTVTPSGAPSVTLALKESPESLALWPHPFIAELAVTLSDSLTITLTQVNSGLSLMTVAGALHSYFAISDISQMAISGLSGVSYLDYVDGRTQKQQSGAITVDQEVDRIYIETTDDVIIDDRAGNRQIRVAKTGSATTVVWNPWIAKTASLADCVDDAYQRMVCVESVNTLNDSVSLAPGNAHQLSQTISVE